MNFLRYINGFPNVSHHRSVLLETSPSKKIQARQKLSFTVDILHVVCMYIVTEAWKEEANVCDLLSCVNKGSGFWPGVSLVLASTARPSHPHRLCVEVDTASVAIVQTRIPAMNSLQLLRTKHKYHIIVRHRIGKNSFINPLNKITYANNYQIYSNIIIYFTVAWCHILKLFNNTIDVSNTQQII